MHGGGSKKRHGGRPPTHGLYSEVLKVSLADRIEQYRKSPELGDLQGVLAWLYSLRDMVAAFLDEAREGLAQAAAAEPADPESTKARAAGSAKVLSAVERLQPILAQIVATEASRHRIVSGDRMTFTVLEVDRLLHYVDDAIDHFVPADKREAAREYLERRISGQDASGTPGT